MAKFKPTNMSKETNNSTQEERQMTPEELEQARKNLLKYYKEQNEILTLQDKFQSLKANIAENQAKELMWIIRKGQMLQGPPKDPDLDPNENPDNPGGQTDGSKSRKLKTE